MTKHNSIVEFSEPLALAGLEERWNQGDQLGARHIDVRYTPNNGHFAGS